MAKLLFEELKWMHKTGRLASPQDTIEALPTRLKQVMKLVLQGKAAKEIAWELGQSVHTIREHMQRLYAWFDVSGRDELVSRFRTARY